MEVGALLAVLLVLVVLLVVVVLVLASLYNRLVRLRNAAEEAWSGIDVELTRRHDLIGNLVETVRGYAEHEQAVLTDVTQARAAAVAAGGVGEQAQAEQGLTGALRSLFAVAESYPQLQADEGFRQLQAELASTEDRIAGVRQRYNGAVRAYDTALETFPTNLVGTLFSFEPREYFALDDPDAREPVEVRF